MTGSLTRANALPPPMSPSLASSLAPRQKPLTNAWAIYHLPPRRGSECSGGTKSYAVTWLHRPVSVHAISPFRFREVLSHVIIGSKPSA